MNGIYQLSSSAVTVKKLIENKLWKQALIDSFWAPFHGTDMNSLVQKRTNLTKEAGKGEVFTIRKKLVGAGVEGDAQLEGNEEALDTASFETSLQIYRHATKLKKGLTAQYDEFNMPQEAQNALKDWMAEKIDDKHFEAIYANHTNIVYGGDASSLGTIEAADKVTPTLLRKINAQAKTGFGRRINPLVPVKYKGKSYYIFLAHPYAIYDLKEDTDMKQYMINALPSSMTENPIFSGADFIFDGLVIISHEKVAIGNNGGAGSVPYSKNLLLGAQSLLFTEGKRPRIIPQTGDYDYISSYGIEAIFHVDKPKFDSFDHGSIEVITSRTAL